MQKKFDVVLTNVLVNAGLIPEVDIVGMKLPETDPKLLVGVSGGVDSMTLAHLLLHSSAPARIVVAHCNFHLRGEESDGDEALVRDFCAANGVELCTADFDTAGYARENGLSIETAARELRYGWFAKLCAEKGYAALVVAHNANDNAETLFLNLLRGTGLRGLCGMRPLSVVPASSEPETTTESTIESAAAPAPTLTTELTSEPTSESTPDPATAPTVNDCAEPHRTSIPLLRPLLGFTRDEIETYAHENDIRWREDSTNAANDCRRNILRNEVFPLLAEINPSFVRTLNREMQYFADADDLVESVVPDILRDGKVDIDELLRHDHWPLFLFHLLRPFNFNSTVIDDIADHIGEDDAHKGSRIFLSPTHRLQITSRNLLISERPEVAITDTYIYNTGIYKIIDGTIREVAAEIITDSATGQGEGRTLNIEVIPRDSLTDLKAPRGITYLDADKVTFPFMLRGWRHGDWFRPLGMNGAAKKVSDLFVDLKYSASDKSSALFLIIPFPASPSSTSSSTPSTSSPTSPTPSSHILALIGERIDDSVKVTSSTTKALRITLQ